jgi:hypothetical protein
MSFAAFLAALALTTGEPRTSPVPSSKPDGGHQSAGASPLDRRRAVVFWRITVALRLGPEDAAKVFDILDRYAAKIAAVRRQRGVLMTEIQAAVNRPASDPTLTDLVNRWLQLQADGRSIHESRWRALGSVLSPVQQAQILVLLPRLE